MKETFILNHTDSYEIIKDGGIIQNNNFILYGYYNDSLFFVSRKSQDYCFSKKLENNLDKNLSCKFIEGENFICAMIINSHLTMRYLTYHINISGSSSLELSEKVYSRYYDNILDIFLYDTEKNNIKLICAKFSSRHCKFIEIKFEYNKTNVTFIGSDSLYFNSEVIEKDCYLSLFNFE